MSRRSKVIIHIAFWVITTMVNFITWGHFEEFNTTYWEWSVINITLQMLSRMLCFYVNYFWLVPRFLAKKKYAYFIFLTILNGLLHIWLCSHLWVDFMPDKSVFELQVLGPMSWSFIFHAMVATGLKMLDIWDSSEKKKQQLEKELRETELLFLQSQMSPHFLFNTLNNIYGLSLNKSGLTGKSVNQLQDLMKYFQYIEQGNKVSLDKELECLEGFIDLHKLRNTVNVVFRSVVHVPIEITYIDPMLLLPFVENAFKHGDLNKNISIDLLVDEHHVSFEVKNSMSPNKRKDAVGGIGIKNIERRLELLYPKRHMIVAQEMDGLFFLYLKISLNE